MPVLQTTALNLQNHQGKTWRKNIRSGVLAQLAPRDPELQVGVTDRFVFTGTPKAELVGESANKSSMDGTPGKMSVRTYKLQVTYRFSQETKWQDEDYQTQLIENLANNAALAISRALDLLAIHGINPLTGTTGGVTDYLRKSGNGVAVVTRTANAQTDIENMAKVLQTNGYIATGIAFDPIFAGELARAKNTQAQPLYPELGLGFGFTSFQGLDAASSDTVSGKQEISGGSTLRGVMADWNTFSWGIARDLPLALIEYGDPDGGGDLQRKNELAIRAESVIGFGFADYAAYVMLNGLTPSA